MLFGYGFRVLVGVWGGLGKLEPHMGLQMESVEVVLELDLGTLARMKERACARGILRRTGYSGWFKEILLALDAILTTSGNYQ